MWVDYFAFRWGNNRIAYYDKSSHSEGNADLREPRSFLTAAAHMPVDIRKIVPHTPR
jgi:hypothetical protein